MSVNTKINGQLVKSAGLYNSIIPLGIADIYSDEERMIGCWRDGKPIYQKCVNFGAMPNASVKYVPHGIAGIDTLVHFEFFPYDSARTFLTMPYTVTQSQYINFQTNFIVDATNIGVECGTDRSAFSGYAILQYTKMNDTAGSGIWTPSGAQAVHYSTAEQIIGTWINGETLYEKTIDFGAFPSNTSKAVAHGISNLKQVAFFSGITKYSNVEFQPLPIVNNTKCRIYIDETNITIVTTEGWACPSTYITLRYTKTS